MYHPIIDNILNIESGFQDPFQMARLGKWTVAYMSLMNDLKRIQVEDKFHPFEAQNVAKWMNSFKSFRDCEFFSLIENECTRLS
jgi:hypothetical protein